jgi:hypothetical protein
MALLLGIPLWSLGIYSLAGLLIAFITYTVIVTFNTIQSKKTEIVGHDGAEVQQYIAQSVEKVEMVTQPTPLEESAESILKVVDEDTKFITQNIVEDRKQSNIATIAETSSTIIQNQLSIEDQPKFLSSQIKQLEQLKLRSQQQFVKLDEIGAKLDELAASHIRNVARLEKSEENFNNAIQYIDEVLRNFAETQAEQRLRQQHNIPQPQAEVDRAILSASPQDPIKEHNQGM